MRAQVPGAKIIGFPRGAGAMLLPYAEITGIDAVGLDWMVDRAVWRAIFCSRMSPVQGNLDPLALLRRRRGARPRGRRRADGFAGGR